MMDKIRTQQITTSETELNKHVLTVMHCLLVHVHPTTLKY